MQASTRPIILVGRSQFGHIIGSAFVDNNPIQKYTTALKRMNNTPIINKVSINHSIFFANRPPYIIAIPTKTKINANERILLILLEYTNFCSCSAMSVLLKDSIVL